MLPTCLCPKPPPRLPQLQPPPRWPTPPRLPRLQRLACCPLGLGASRPQAPKAGRERLPLPAHPTAPGTQRWGSDDLCSGPACQSHTHQADQHLVHCLSIDLAQLRQICNVAGGCIQSTCIVDTPAPVMWSHENSFFPTIGSAMIATTTPFRRGCCTLALASAARSMSSMRSWDGFNGLLRCVAGDHHTVYLAHAHHGHAFIALQRHTTRAAPWHPLFPKVLVNIREDVLQDVETPHELQCSSSGAIG